MVEIVVCVIAVVLGYVWGWYARERHAMRIMNNMLENTEAIIKKEIRENVVPVIVEKHNGAYFVYNMNDHTFMAQGNTREEVEKVLSEKYPGKNFAAKDDNLAEVGFNDVSV